MASLDRGAIIIVRRNIIRKYVAMSQSIVAMGRAEFQRSKWAVLDIAASLIEVPPAQLERETKRLEYEGDDHDAASGH